MLPSEATPPPDRSPRRQAGPPLLVIDESLNPRLAAELSGRGRSAAGLAELGLTGFLDAELLEALGRRLEPGWTLVTADDRLPVEHARAFAVLSGSVATLDPRRPSGSSLDQWRRELVHRWAHQIEAQQPGAIRRYSVRGGRPWRPRGRAG